MTNSSDLLLFKIQTIKIVRDKHWEKCEKNNDLLYEIELISFELQIETE